MKNAFKASFIPLFHKLLDCKTAQNPKRLIVFNWNRRDKAKGVGIFSAPLFDYYNCIKI